MVAASVRSYFVAHIVLSEAPLSVVPVLVFPKVPFKGAHRGVKAGLGVNVLMAVAVEVRVMVGVMVKVAVEVGVGVGESV